MTQGPTRICRKRNTGRTAHICNLYLKWTYNMLARINRHMGCGLRQAQIEIHVDFQGRKRQLKIFSADADFTRSKLQYKLQSGTLLCFFSSPRAYGLDHSPSNQEKSNLKTQICLFIPQRLRLQNCFLYFIL